MPNFSHRSQWDKLYQKLQSLKALPDKGEQWAREGAELMNNNMLDHLRTQGRGKHSPRLRSLTLHLYTLRGNPNGSGIRKHIQVRHKRMGNASKSLLGIPNGRPTMITKVQNSGATIQITPRMRRWFGRYKVYFKPSKTTIRIPGRGVWDKSLRNTNRVQKIKLKQLFRR
ncbi:MAG: hypothetical protein KME11_04960 [Timaviella obliquedivisa GSE-PSE-MK23-08B]|jgi:hypothetical protein|nr:hypothetical protein [Timaviella obliquedivisa GSE-PSE-MK23-08B]